MSNLPDNREKDMTGEFVDGEAKGGHVTPPETQFVGAITEKIPVSKVIAEWHEPLAMISIVHIRGTRKYNAYSWLTDPNASNSTVQENIDALWRHFTAHSMGRPVDTEGLPHIFHMACRAGMLISTFYRKKNRLKPAYQDVKTYVKDNYSFGYMLTPEEIFSLSKGVHDIQMSTFREQRTPLLMDLLIRASLYKHKVKPNFDLKMNMFDILFMRILEFARSEWHERHIWKDQIGELTPEEIEYFNIHLDYKSEKV